MRKCASLFYLSVMVLSCIVGCAGPAKRAKVNPAVFQRLAPADQTLVLHGKVRAGLGQAAVRIAWGEPDTVDASGGTVGPKDHPDGKSGGARSEIWTYRRQISIHGPIGSYDQWQPGRYFVTPGTPRFFAAGYGFGGPGNEGLLMYEPRVRYSDSYVRRALFVSGKLERFDTYYGEFAALP